MRTVNISAILVLFLTITMLTTARPHSRHKRSGISDQRLAELETLLALSKLRNNMMALPVAMGVVDPRRIGKRKRSFNMQEETEDVTEDYNDSAEFLPRYRTPQNNIIRDFYDEYDIDY